MNKKLLSLLLFSVIIIAGCQSPQKVIEKFEGAVEEKDAEGLFNLVELEDNVHWTEKEAEDVITYFTENKSAYDEQLSLLQDQKDALKEKQELKNEAGIFYFDDKKNFFARAYDVSLDEDSFVAFKKLSVSVLADEEVTREGGSDEEIAVGLFGPGKYSMKGNADYGYVQLEGEDDFDTFDTENFTKKIKLDLKGDSATIFSTLPETALSIDGTEVDHDISAEGGQLIQPLVDGLTIQAKNKFEWGELVSEEVESSGLGIGQIGYIDNQSTAEKGVDFTPYMFANEEEKEEIVHVITDFNEKLLKGLAKNDPSYLDDVAATKEAVAGYDSDFELLTSVEAGTVSAGSFPPGTAVAFIGHYEGGLLESIIDFNHVINIKDEETGEDLLVLNVNLYSNFNFIPESMTVDKKRKHYLGPEISLKKENDKWVIAEQLVNLKGGSDNSNLNGEGIVMTKAGK